jgi:hypothetical protein
MIEFRAEAFTPERQRRASQALRAHVAFDAGTDDDIAYELLSAVTLPPGRYQLRLTVNALTRRTSGIVELSVEVPDVSESQLTWSELAFHVAPGVVVAGTAEVRTGLPFVPTTQRIFFPDDIVTTFARLHQGGGAPLVPVNVAISVIASDGTTAWEQIELLRAERFVVARGADVLASVPVADLEPGVYRLRLESRLNGISSVREARFTVR